MSRVFFGMAAAAAAVALVSRTQTTLPSPDRPGRYWTWKELTLSAKGRRLGLDNTPPPQARANLRWMVERVLDPLRAQFGAGVRVNSGYRSPAVNRAVGGVTNSLHQHGLAFDLSGVVMSDPAAEPFLKRLGMEVIRYPTHLHIEVPHSWLRS